LPESGGCSLLTPGLYTPMAVCNTIQYSTSFIHSIFINIFSSSIIIVEVIIIRDDDVRHFTHSVVNS